MKTFLIEYLIYTDGPRGRRERHSWRQVKAHTTQEAQNWLVNYWLEKGKQIYIAGLHEYDPVNRRILS